MKTVDYHRLVKYSQNLNLIEKGLSLVQIYYPPNGNKRKTIDILCEDSKNNLVIIEEKKTRIAGNKIINQLSEYYNLLKKEYPNRFIRIILISPSINENKLSYYKSITNYNIKFIKHHFEKDVRRILISEKTWEWLIAIKFKNKYSNMNQVVDCLLEIASNSNYPEYAVLKSFFTSNKAKKSGKNGKSSKTSNF